jgi:delta 1-pyrroline-5-carboxylate dehydrogenase
VAFEIARIADLREEVFGPVLHVVRWSGDVAEVVRQINALGYGLTLGVQTRIDSRAQHIADTARVGNVYVNRNMIGAVVGVQPFGGEGLSGTGPKAGGPALSVPLLRRTDGDHQHRGRRRQCRTAGGLAAGLTTAARPGSSADRPAA